MRKEVEYVQMNRTDRVILLVEDNPGDVELTMRALKRNKIANDVVVARDGVEALDFLFNTGSYEGKPANPLPEVVLLDLKLPKVDGIEVLRQIRSDPRTQFLPVIMLTTSGEDRDVTACYSGGVNSYVRKPVDFSEFSEAVRQIGLYWLVLNIGPAPHAPGT